MIRKPTSRPTKQDGGVKIDFFDRIYYCR